MRQRSKKDAFLFLPGMRVEGKEVFKLKEQAV